MNKKNNIENYTKFWQDLPAEIKPLPSAINFWEDKIREILKQNKDPQALILGVTPEIRDLLARYKIRTICLDKNKIMIEAMQSLIKIKNPKEKIVCGDWLKIPFPKNNFDLVLTDCPQDNLPYQKWDNFFENVFQVLKPKGYWLLGTTFFRGYQEGINLNELIKIYRQNPKLFKNPSWKFYYHVKLASHHDFYNEKIKRGDWIKFEKQLSQLYQDKKISQREFNDLQMSTDQLGQSLACQFTWVTQEKFHQILKNHHFYILGYREDDVYPAGKFRWGYILKK